MKLRFFGRGADARFAEDLTSDARSAPDHPQHAERDPDSERRQRRRRNLLGLALGGVFVIGLITLLLGHGGVVDARRLTRELGSVERDVVEQRARVAELERSVESLDHDTFPRERIAREQLGFARPGEVTFIFPDEPGRAELPEDGS